MFFLLSLGADTKEASSGSGRGSIDSEKESADIVIQGNGIAGNGTVRIHTLPDSLSDVSLPHFLKHFIPKNFF